MPQVGVCSLDANLGFLITSRGPRMQLELDLRPILARVHASDTRKTSATLFLTASTASSTSADWVVDLCPEAPPGEVNLDHRRRRSRKHLGGTSTGANLKPTPSTLIGCISSCVSKTLSALEMKTIVFKKTPSSTVVQTLFHPVAVLD